MSRTGNGLSPRRPWAARCHRRVTSGGEAPIHADSFPLPRDLHAGMRIAQFLDCEHTVRCGMTAARRCRIPFPVHPSSPLEAKADAVAGLLGVLALDFPPLIPPLTGSAAAFVLALPTLPEDSGDISLNEWFSDCVHPLLKPCRGRLSVIPAPD